MQATDTTNVGEQIAELDFRAALEKSQSKVMSWVEGFITHLPNIVAALLIFAIFMVVARIVRGVVSRVLRRVSSNSDVNRLISTLAFVFVLFAGVFFALDVLDLDRTVTSLLAGAGIVGLALGFAFQDTAENFISGVFLAVRGQFTDGDIIETNEHRGVVQDVNLRSTVIRTFSGQLVILPNSKVFKNPVVNYTAYSLRRVDIEVGVSYGDDLRKAAAVASRSVAGYRPVSLSAMSKSSIPASMTIRSTFSSASGSRSLSRPTSSKPAAKPSCASRKLSTVRGLPYHSRSARSISAASVGKRCRRRGRTARDPEFTSLA